MPRKMSWAHRLTAAVGALICCVIIYQVDATVGQKVKSINLKGTVVDNQDRPLVGAKVYFIDSTTVDTTPITQPGIIAGTTEGFDEPLEDIVNNPDKVKNLPVATTNKQGKFSVKKLNRALNYYTFVVPAAEDVDHIPGGDASRNALSPAGIPRSGLTIHMSWKVPADATYIGASACLQCHTDKTGWKKHAHALLFVRPSGPTANQDPSFHSHWFDVAAKFLPAATFAGGTVLNFQDFDTTNANKYIIYEGTPKAGTPVELKIYLWTDTATGVAKVTMENVRNPADPNSPKTYAVPALMGGYLRQRVLLRIPGLKNMWPVFGYQAFPGTASQGLMSNYDRSRKPWQESGPGGGGLLSSGSSTLFYTRGSTPATSLLTQPPATSHNAAPACTTCHFTGYSAFTDPTTGEALAHGVSDVNGAVDFDGDGAPDESGIGCEVCHGPGSRHREEALLALTPTTPTAETAARSKTPVDNHKGKFILNPNLLCNDRGALICGRCHAGPGLKDSSKLPPPGLSRAEYLATYADPAQKGTPPTVRNAPKFWPDNEHERGGHEGLTYANWIESTHARNSRQLVVCYDCHDLHGSMQFRYGLVADPDNSETGLCNQCHTQVITDHVLEKTGSVMAGTAMACRQCHMPRTGKGGAGRPGLFIGTPQSTTTNAIQSDANIVYWENDQSSHIWDVPHKFNAGVAGVQPGLAMPVPYTNSCGTCHDPSKLPFQAPSQ